jgi:hypothetical protein
MAFDEKMSRVAAKDSSAARAAHPPLLIKPRLSAVATLCRR